MSDLSSSLGGVDGDSPGVHPNRILFVSADMGAGHNATARAVEQAAQRLWPDAQTRWVDALDTMGPGVGPVFRQIYVTNVQTTPWLYEFFYDSLWRYRWFATASKRFVGEWCGRRLAPVIDDYVPDLIVSTYPLGSAGLQWLRTQRGLDVPIAAWISDFAPHPFWVYRGLDVHFVMHDACISAATRAEPSASVQVAAPPVVDAFGPGNRSVARDKLGLDQDAFVAVLSCGYFGFGTVEKAVDTLLAADPRVQIVAVCGRNEQLREKITARGAPPHRLLALGWVDDMATYVAASDVVVTNAGGATSLEAMACGRTVVMFEPIAAHGRANAELMAEAGLAVLCRTPAQLREAVSGLLDHPDRLATLEHTALAHAESRTREDDLRLVAGQRESVAGLAHLPHLRRLAPEDAFFLYADTPQVNQMLGGVVYLDGHVGYETALAEIERRLGGLPNLRRRLVAGRGGWGRPAWLLEDRVDLRYHVRERVLGAEGEPATMTGLIDGFFSSPLDLRRQPWELHLVQGLEGGRSGILVKLHHVLGDGFAAIDSMAGLLDEVPGESPDAAAHGGHAPATHGSAPRSSHARADGADTGDSAGRQAKSTRRQIQDQGKRVGAGLWKLARIGRAPHSGLDGTTSGGRRRHALVSLPVPDVRTAARALGTGTNALLLTLIADGVNRVLSKRGERTEGSSFRVMVPRTVRTIETRHALGNITAAVPVDLPLGTIPPRARLAEVEARMQRGLGGGQPEATRFLMKAMGALPAPVHARLARGVYSARWFNAIVSVIPGPRRQQSFAGVKLTEVFPVLPMADGVGLAVGLMRWADTFAVGLTGDAALAGDIDDLADAVRDAFAEFQEAARS